MTHKSIKYSFLILVVLVSACTAAQMDEEPEQFTAADDNLNGNSLPVSTPPPSGDVILSEDLEYLGAFRLPGGWDRPETFAYGGNAMTFNPEGDQGGAQDGFHGSLFVMSHDRMAYGDLPDGNQVAEVSIPSPIQSRNIEELNTAEFTQDFKDIAKGHFSEMDEIPKTGMQYLNHPATGPKIHLAWGQHLQPPDIASHAWFDPALSSPDMQGDWFIGKQNLYSVNGYMFEVPLNWADAYTGGKYIATGRMRDGGQGGMGPTIFAYTPWQTDGSPPPSGSCLQETTLLLYENAYNTDEIVRAMDGYQHADEWEGGVWLTSPSGKSAVIFGGTKSMGEKYWYGYIHPDGPDKVCVDASVTDFQTCRMADGGLCPASDLKGCCNEDSGTCVSLRGWWTNRFDAQIIFYDPADLARVAVGEIESWQPQPYAVIDIDEYLYLNPPEWDLVMLGWGDQRRYRIGDMAFDRANGFIYLLELFTDEAKPVVHVWRVNG